MLPTPPRQPLARRWVWWAIGPILVALVVALALEARPLYALMADQDRVRLWVESLGPRGPAAIFVLEFAQVLLAPLPGHAVGAVSGYLYGPWLGTLYAMSGLVAGSLLAFALVRWFGRPVVRRLAGPESLDRLDHLAGRESALFFLLLWLFPFTPDDLACMAAALTPMSPLRFLVVMALGRLPGVFASVWVGAKAAKISLTWWTVLPVGLAGTAAALALWRWRQPIQAAVLRLLDSLLGSRDGQ